MMTIRLVSKCLVCKCIKKKFFFNNTQTLISDIDSKFKNSLTGFRLSQKETSRVSLKNCIFQRTVPSAQGQKQGKYLWEIL